MVSVPPTITIAEGATSTTFAIGTDPIHGNKDRAVTIEASYNGITRSATLTLAPPQNAVITRPAALCASATIAPCVTTDAVRAAAATIAEHEYSLYLPELSLLAETQPTTGPAPAIAYEYVWFGGQPLAQVETATGAVHYYFNDHLGTPIIQTDASANIVWRAEYEPYGDVHAFRAGATKHQPLRFPGQENDGTSELSYNVFRHYRSAWGRYTQADPVGLSAGINLYRYGFSNPNTYTDRTGLFVDPTKALEDLAKTLIESCKALTGGPKPLPIFAIGAAIVLDATPASNATEHAAEQLLKVPFPKCAKKCQENNCPPCNPPVGTIGYNYDKVPPHDPHPGIDGDHIHYFQMQQIPHNCDCRWKNLHIAGGPPPVSYAVPLPTSDPWP